MPDDLLDRARAADLFALVELAARRDANEVVVRARDTWSRSLAPGTCMLCPSRAADCAGWTLAPRGPIDCAVRQKSA